MSYSYHSAGGRRRRNELSRSWANKDGQSWSRDDDEMIVEFWIKPGPHREEEEIAKALERTIESCRNRAHKLLVDLGQDNPHTVLRKTRTTTETVEYIGAFDEEEDKWWA